ncbi:MAG: YdeI/OmpD-associated family protein [Acidimicrobiia bacterium]|nr:YdeI/OmpD-associated family protein [Acidimicrobiia bacterium]
MPNPKVDAYIQRSELWPDELSATRAILLEAGLSEGIKWGKPCFSHDGHNIVIAQEMKHFLSLMFFKGALLRDPENVLVAQGPNSRSAKRMEFTSVDDVSQRAATLAAYVEEAIDIEEAGLEVEPTPPPTLVDELRARLDRDPQFKAAFEALTPGRQREYNLHFSAAKQAATREARIEKYAGKILAGKGFRDR